MITAISHDMEERFKDPKGERLHLQIAHTENEEAALDLKREIQELFPATGEMVTEILWLFTTSTLPS